LIPNWSARSFTLKLADSGWLLSFSDIAANRLLAENPGNDRLLRSSFYLEDFQSFATLKKNAPNHTDRGVLACGMEELKHNSSSISKF